MNKKGFAISTILYGLIFVTIAVFYLIIKLESTRHIANTNYINNVREELNNIITNNNINSENPSTPFIGSQAMMSVINSKGNSVYVIDSDCNTNENIYYLSGSNDTINFNYVWYSGKMWRITAIYPDGSMKMVTDNNITTIAFNESSNIYYDTSTSSKSYMFQWLNEDFYDTLNDVDNAFIDLNKLWNTTDTGSTNPNVKPSNFTLISSSLSKVGTLNSYEYYLSYKNLGEYNSESAYSNGYLNLGYYWRLINPCSSVVWVVRTDGYAYYTGEGYNDYYLTYKFGVRPAIYLKSGVLMIGSGTKSNPYRLVGDYNAAASGDALNTRQSGEYLKFSDSDTLYRIVSIENNTTKIVSTKYIEDGSTKTDNYYSNFGTGSDDSYWDYYLNTTWYNKLSFKNKLVSGTYYLGQEDSIQSYKLSICASYSENVTTKNCTKTTIWSPSNSYNGGMAYVGLLREGEMFAAAQGSESTTLLITQFNDGRWLNINRGGTGRYWDHYYTARPTYNLASSVTISSGTGLENDPYVININ